MLSQTINLYEESIWEYNKIFQTRKNLQKSTSYECFLRGFVELRVHHNEGVNQEKDMGSKSRQRSPRRSNQLIQIGAGSDRDGWMQDGCFKKKRGRVCPREKQKLGGFYKSVKSLKN